MSEIHVLTIKEPYASALVTGAISTILHKLNLVGKTCLIHVGTETDLKPKESAAYFKKIGDLPLTQAYYEAVASGEEVSKETLDAAEAVGVETEDGLLFSLLTSKDDEKATKQLEGHIIGLVSFEEMDPIQTRFKNHTGTYQLFPQEMWRTAKGAANLTVWTGEKFW